MSFWTRVSNNLFLDRPEPNFLLNKISLSQSLTVGLVEPSETKIRAFRVQGLGFKV